MKNSLEQIRKGAQTAGWIGLALLLFVAQHTRAHHAAGPSAIPDVDDVYPRPIPDVNAVYPTSSERLQNSTFLTVGDSYESQRLFTTMLRHLMPQGANVFIETRPRDTLDSWTQTNRLRRRIHKHNPDSIAISFDLKAALADNPDRLKNTINQIVTGIGPIKCYWFGSMTMLSDEQKNETIADWVKPCTYIDPGVMDPETLKKHKRGYSKTDTDKWAEKMWQRWIQAHL